MSGGRRASFLFMIMMMMIKAKSPRAVKLTKVKGRATDREVLRGELEIEHKKGNDEADDAVERGVKEGQVVVEAFSQHI